MPVTTSASATVDAADRDAVHALVERATSLGHVTGLIHAAGVSPSQASPETVLKVDLYGTALVLEEFGNVIAPGGSGVVISSQSGHRLPALTAEQDKALATTPVAPARPAVPPARPSAGHASRLPARQARQLPAGRGRGGPVGQARRPGQHDQPRHRHHRTGQGRAQRAPRRRLPAHDPVLPGGARRVPDEVGAVGALLMGPDGGFISGSDFLMDGGVTAAYWFGDLPEVRN